MQQESEQYQQELLFILKKIARGTATESDAQVLAGYLGLSKQFKGELL